MNNSKTINNNDFKTFFESKGLMFGKRLEKSQKTKQQKLIDSISKEIKIMSKRTDLNLLLIGDDDNKRSEPPIEGADIKKIIPKLNNFLPIFKRSISFIQINRHIVYFF